MLDLERHVADVVGAHASAVAVGVHASGTAECFVAGAPENAQFRIASLTKPFLAELALAFAEDGLLDLGAPALDGAPTFRQLLSHEGGVQPDLANMERFGDGDDALGAAVREVLARKRRFSAGRAWEYANSGYWIVADAVAPLSGVEFEQVFDGELLQPLRLMDTDWVGDRLLGGHDERLRPVAARHTPRVQTVGWPRLDDPRRGGLR